MVAVRDLPRRHAARPARRRRSTTDRARRLRRRRPGRLAAGRRRRRRRGSSCPELGCRRARRARDRLAGVEPWTAETPAAVRRRAGHGRGAGRAADRLPHGGDRGRRADASTGGGSLFRGVNRHEFHPERGRAVDAAHDARRRAADEAAQRQRGADQPLSAASAFPRAVRRVRPVRHRRVRSGDARVRLRRLAGQPGRRPAMARGASWTGCGGWWSGTRTTPRWSCGRWATRPAAETTWRRWRRGSATRDPSRPGALRGRLPPSTPTCTAGCTPHAEVEQIGGAPRNRIARPGATRAGGCRSSCASTPTRWATVRAGSPSTRQLFERYPRVPGRVRVGVDRPRPAHPERRAIFGYGGDFGEPLHDGTSSSTAWCSPTARPRPGLLEFAT